MSAPLEPPPPPELIELVRRFLAEEVLAEVTDGKVKHRVRVAINLLALAGREVALDAPALDRDGRAAPPELIDRYGSVAELTERLAAGDLSIVDPDIHRLLTELTDLRTAVAAPLKPPSPPAPKDHP